MPRQRRSTRLSTGTIGDVGRDPQTGRVAAFERTKMCKFHILGVCAKGSNCCFAHDKEELQRLPDLACTKLCKSLINTGQCDDPTCTYAHTKDDLRVPPVADALPTRRVPKHDYQQQHQQQPQEATALTDYAMFLQHVGQAAQAHALEAARLHAAAMQIHAGADAVQEAVPDHSGAAQYFPLKASPGRAHSHEDSSPLRSPLLVAQPEPDDGASNHPASLMNDSCQQNLASAMSRMLGSEPVLIRTEHLRSMSSNSLHHMALQENDEEDVRATPDFDVEQNVGTRDGTEPFLDKRLQAFGLAEALDAGAITVKNTFLDFAPPASALRSVRTAGGRLDLLGRRPSSPSMDILEGDQWATAHSSHSMICSETRLLSPSDCISQTLAA